jgi:hypothetical protein
MENSPKTNQNGHETNILKGNMLPGNKQKVEFGIRAGDPALSQPNQGRVQRSNR